MGDPSLGEIQFSDSVIMGKSGVELEAPENFVVDDSAPKIP
jgi:hypothetical protein